MPACAGADGGDAVTEPLLAALDGLVPPDHSVGDWDDVLARAGVNRSTAARLAPRRRRRLLLAAVVAVAVAAVAAPALALLLGWIDRRDVSFSNGRPAPNVVKKGFYDVEPGRADAGFGGCREYGETFRVRFVLDPPAAEVGRRAARRVLALEGDLTARDARRIVLVYGDGARTTIPFVYVSKPIDAGFFAFAVPRDRQAGKRAPVRALLLDAAGRVTARSYVPRPRTFPHTPVSPRPRFRASRLPTRLPSPPKPPLQHGSGDGASVTVGANGVAIWRTGGVSRERARLLRGSYKVSYTCFRLTRVFGFADIRARAIDGAFAPQAAVGYVRLGRPIDGCDIAGGGYGHRWPDRFRSHSPVGIPLTPRGRRFFTDRAAARDLALFVRSRRTQQIRKLNGAAFEREFHRHYPRPGGIRYTLTERGVTFTETSSTGKRFEVVVRDGRIAGQNLNPYAVVY